jgi:hypothetical protein
MKENRIVAFGKKIYLSDDKTLKYEFLREAHKFKLAVHSRSTKMYRDLKDYY